MPKLRRPHQSRSHRIRFNISNDLFQFVAVPDKVIERLILPKGGTGAPNQSISSPRSGPLQPAHQNRNLDARPNDSMNVIRHHAPSREFIKPALPGPCQNAAGYDVRDLRLRQPPRTRGASVENAIVRHKGMPRAAVADRLHICRQRPLKPPRKKNPLFSRMQVRKFSPIVNHAGSGQAQSFCPTCLVPRRIENSQGLVGQAFGLSSLSA